MLRPFKYQLTSDPASPNLKLELVGHQDCLEVSFGELGPAPLIPTGHCRDCKADAECQQTGHRDEIPLQHSMPRQNLLAIGLCQQGMMRASSVHVIDLVIHSMSIIKQTQMSSRRLLIFHKSP